MSDMAEQLLHTTANDTAPTTFLHVVLFTFPLKGHIHPALNLAQRLHSQGVSITLLSAQYLISPLQSMYCDKLHSKFQLVGFSEEEPRPPHFDPDSRAGIGWAFKSTDRMRDSFTKLISRVLIINTSKTPVCIVSDYFLGWTQDVAQQFHLPWYAYHPSSASHLALLFYTPVILSQHLHLSSLQLHDDETTHFVDAEDAEGFCVPGLGRLELGDLPEQFRNGFPMLFFRLNVDMATRLHTAASVLVNTFEELEKKPLEALRTNSDQLNPNAVNVFPIGLNTPINSPDQLQATSSTTTREVQKALNWLDKQAISSVLYICFGSLFIMDVTQMQELALGLEASGHPFFWVLRLPTPSGELQGQLDIFEVLPPGFLSRTRDQGKVFVGWAPQLQILSHISIGGFLSHCGWNSILESIVMGVPILAFPQQSDQMLNAKLISEELRIARMLAKGSDGLVEKCEIERGVRMIMEDRECWRERARDTGIAARIATREGGVSHTYLSSFIHSAHTQCNTFTCMCT